MRRGVHWCIRAVSVALFALAIWLAWPMLTLRDFPHVTLRSYAAILVMALASSTAKALD